MTRTTLTQNDIEAMPGVLAAVLADPGVTTYDLSRKLGHPLYRVRKVLTDLRGQGLVGLVRSGLGQAVRWYPPAVAVAVRREAEAVARDKRRDLKRAYRAKCDAAQRAGPLDDEADDWPVTRRSADARSLLPFVCVAPASVFHLGAT